MCDHMIVVTGGPGSGKSSVINAMARRGFLTMPEAGRAIIKDQIRIGGSALPWADRTLFAELMLGRELRSYHEALGMKSPVIMDRGIPDVVGYLTLCGLRVPAHVEMAAQQHPYCKRVFLAPYWAEIFARDEERKQDRDEAKTTGQMMAETYTRLGYEVVELPLAGVHERVDFIAASLKAP
ncbi:AAA family ATPase [Roseivivax marinus]|uniref:AAA family ATPase n=1 Tax=Roseivivax marinus TaxID=1379903 RepID=UPI00273FBDEA|nr:AAA family ATPase [Roseivivax marinus]